MGVILPSGDSFELFARFSFASSDIEGGNNISSSSLWDRESGRMTKFLHIRRRPDDNKGLFFELNCGLGRGGKRADARRGEKGWVRKQFQEFVEGETSVLCAHTGFPWKGISKFAQNVRAETPRVN